MAQEHWTIPTPLQRGVASQKQSDQTKCVILAVSDVLWFDMIFYCGLTDKPRVCQPVD